MVVSKRWGEPLFLFLAGLFWFGHFSYNAYFTPYLTDVLGFTASAAGLVVGVYGIVQMIVRVPLGLLADALHRHKLIIVGGFFLQLLMALIFRFSTSYTLMLLARMLAGMSASSWLSFVVLYQSLSSTDVGKASARAMAANSIGTLLAFVFGSFFYDIFGMQFLFAASIVTAVAGLLLCPLLPENKTAMHPPIRLSEIAKVLKNKHLWNCALITTLGQFVAFGTSLSFTSNYAQTLGATGVQLGISSIIASVGTAGSSFVASFTARTRKNDWLLNMLGFVLNALYCVTIPLCTAMGGIYFAQAFGGFGRNVMSSTLMGGSLREIPNHLRSTAMGIFQSIYSLGISLGPIAMGGLLDASAYNWRFAFFVMAGLSVAGIVWSGIALRPRGKEALPGA